MGVLPKGGNQMPQTQHVWHHPIDREHPFPQVEFEVKLHSCLQENPCPRKRGTF
jgi:hypothetical protein